MRTEAGRAGSHLEIDGLAQFWVPPLLEGRIGRQRDDAGLTFESWELLRSWKPMGKYGSKKHAVFVIYLPNSLTNIYIYGLVSGGLVQSCLVVLEFFFLRALFCFADFSEMMINHWNNPRALRPYSKGFLQFRKDLFLGSLGQPPQSKTVFLSGLHSAGPSLHKLS